MSGNRNDPRVLVVGAGIGGLGVARALASRGIAVDIVERDAMWARVGAGIYLPGNAVRALRELDLEPDVTKRAAPIPRQRFCDHRGRLLLEVDLAPLWEGVGPCVALHRADLHEVLSSGVSVRMGMSLTRIRQEGATVTVGFGDGSAENYDVVVGADGIHSTVRDLAFGTGAVRRVGQHAWRFVTECPPVVNTWTVLLGGEVTFLAVPIGHGRLYGYADTSANVDAHGDVTTAGHLRELLSGFGDPAPAILDSLDPAVAVHSGPIEEVVLGSWRRGSVLLVGDAAHATAPNMAEGAAMALEDGLVLAECLVAERNIPQALSSFEKRRGPRTRWVRSQTHRRDRTRNLPPALRNLVLRRWGRKIFHHNYRPLRELP